MAPVAPRLGAQRTRPISPSQLSRRSCRSAQRAPRWLLLTLDAQGRWEADAAGLEVELERSVGNGVTAELPEAWLYWPITAGGLGLRQAQLRAASYAEAFARRTPVAVPDERPGDWQRRNNPWARFYSALLAAVSPVAPTPNAVMETLVKDFISRGAELSAGQQQTLSRTGAGSSISTARRCWSRSAPSASCSANWCRCRS